MSDKKVGLVLEGGAMRGMFTVGALDVFMDEGIHFDGMVGVSAGALFGVNYLSDQRSRALRYSQRFNGDKRYMGMGSFLRTGNYFNTEFAYNTVPYKIDIFDDETFKNSGVPFYAVATDIETGKPEYMLVSSVLDEMDIFRASSSMPFLSKPVEINGRFYLDGGVSNSIPFLWMEKMGYEKLVVVLTRDINYVKKPMNKMFVNMFYRKYPGMEQALLNRHIMYNESLEKLKEYEKSGKAFVLRPAQPLTTSRTEKDPEKLKACYDIGFRDAQGCIPALKEYLEI